MSIVIVKLLSGLGNQLFQYAAGRQLALMHNAELRFDTSFFDNQSLRNYKLCHYNVIGEEASQEELASLLGRYWSSSLVAKAYRRLETHLPKRYHRRFRESEWWVYEPELFRVRPSVYLEGYWQHYGYFKEFHPGILDELTLKAPYPIEAKPLFEAIENDESSVALHIRRGDYVTVIDTQKLMGVLSLDYYSQAIAHIKGKISNPTFYIFSDDLQWAAEHLKPEAPMVLVNIAGGQLDYIELDLMSRCRHAIIANSSFSWWGAFLNRNPAKVVVAPAKWAAMPNINQRIKLQLPSWTIL